MKHLCHDSGQKRNDYLLTQRTLINSRPQTSGSSLINVVKTQRNEKCRGFLKRVLQRRPQLFPASLLYSLYSVVCFFLGNSPASEFYMPTFRNILSVPSSFFTPTRLWIWNRQCVPKRRHIKFRLRGFFIPTCLWSWNKQSAPKRRHIKFRRRGLHTYLPTKLEQTECSETSAYKIQTPGNSYLPAYEAGTDSVPKRRHIKFRRRGLHTYLPLKLEQSVPKRRHMKFRRRGLHTYLPMNLEYTECSETSPYKIQTPGTSYLPAYEAGAYGVLRNVGI